MGDIFISYDRSDHRKAEALAQAFKANGWSVWWDRLVHPGTRFEERIAEALRAARCVVVLWSAESVASDWVRDEAAEGARRKILVPVLLESVEIPLGFRQIQAADLADWNGDVSGTEIQRLLGAIAVVLNQPVRVQKAPLPLYGRPRLIGALITAFVIVLASASFFLSISDQSKEQVNPTTNVDRLPSASAAGRPVSEVPSTTSRRDADRVTGTEETKPRAAVGSPPQSNASVQREYVLKHRFPASIMDDLAFSPDGTLLAGAGSAREQWYGPEEYDGIVNVWDTRTGEVKRTIKTDRIAQYRSASFSPDGRSIAIAGEKRFEAANRTVTIELLDVLSGNIGPELMRMPHATVRTSRFRQDGKVIAAGSAGEIWDRQSGFRPRADWTKLIDPNTKLISDVIRSDEFGEQWATDPRAHFVVGGRSGFIRIFDLVKGPPTNLVASDYATGPPYAVSLDGRHVALTRTANDHNFVLVLDVPSRGIRNALKTALKPTLLSFSSDGERLAVAGVEKVEIWATANGELKEVLEPTIRGALKAVTFSPDNRFLAFGGYLANVFVYERRLTASAGDGGAN